MTTQAIETEVATDVQKIVSATGSGRDLELYFEEPGVKPFTFSPTPPELFDVLTRTDNFGVVWVCRVYIRIRSIIEFAVCDRRNVEELDRPVPKVEWHPLDAINLGVITLEAIEQTELHYGLV